MSVGDEYEEGKLALQRASMSRDEFIDEARSDATPEWLAGNIEDPVKLLEDIAKFYKKDGSGAIDMGLVAYRAFDYVVYAEARSRMQKARDDYEEQYGRRG